ncbi:ArsR family transcriptional regulator [Dehalococcoides mccartyi]|uniref:nucleotidyltransferase domain-containing protein n=1 Tax=Dehalococcoides mccartyi TaxID=61435 RepID=UPI00098FCAA9|nr:nucleotidyltransferase domain-containing protein [Dehalococcoides mccartyi]AQU06474.1 ArsR family transcriptional regulator [Dehalococcoides mccartyi]AQU07916.1 ArsR family transcriptional regulator [Dehalococcoides mccartyi]AQW62944.1 ArsR family transcriptional regulator [Dehalococcoides mccartyi]
MSTLRNKDIIGTTLFGKARRGILSLLYGHLDEEYYLRQIARITDIGVGPVQRELKQLTDSGIIQRRVHNQQVYYQANPMNPVFKELKSLITKTFGMTDILRSALLPSASLIKVAFIFGSIASGNEDKTSDIDIVVIGDISFGDTVTLLSDAEKQLNREINSVVYPTSEFRQKIGKDNYFINNVLEGEKIFIIGDAHGLEELTK